MELKQRGDTYRYGEKFGCSPPSCTVDEGEKKVISRHNKCNILHRMEIIRRVIKGSGRMQPKGLCVCALCACASLVRNEYNNNNNTDKPGTITM